MSASQRGTDVPSIRVLLGVLPATERNAISEAVDSLTDVEVVGVAERPAELLRAAGALDADVVVVATVAGGLPGIATHLIDQYPDIRVLAVTGAGTALSYRLRPQLDEVSCATPDELAAALRASDGLDM